MKIKGYSLKGALGALALGAALLLSASGSTYAQGRYQPGPRQYQRWERNYYRNYNRPYYRGYNNYGPYNRGYYNYRPYNRGYYGNGFRSGYGWGSRPYNRGYYGNGFSFGFGFGRRRW